MIKLNKKPSDEVQKLAVKQTGFAIEYIKEPSVEIQKLAVEQNAYAIMYIPKEIQTLELCILAVSKFCYSIQFIKDEFKEDCEKHIKNNLCNTHVKSKQKCISK